MKKVILESPFAGDVANNIEYARACAADCLQRGEAPFASHLLYTQPGILDDTIKTERDLGIEAGLIWGSAADYTVVYLDRGISGGMKHGIRRAVTERRAVHFRALYPQCDHPLIGDILEGFIDGEFRIRRTGPNPVAGAATRELVQVFFREICS